MGFLLGAIAAVVGLAATKYVLSDGGGGGDYVGYDITPEVREQMIQDSIECARRNAEFEDYMATTNFAKICTNVVDCLDYIINDMPWWYIAIAWAILAVALIFGEFAQANDRRRTLRNIGGYVIPACYFIGNVLIWVTLVILFIRAIIWLFSPALGG